MDSATMGKTSDQRRGNEMFFSGGVFFRDNVQKCAIQQEILATQIVP